MDRAKWFKVHSWVGVKLSILLCFVLITGTFAVLSNELDWLSNSSMRVEPGTATELNWSKVYQQALVEAKARDSEIIRMRQPIDPWFAAEALVANEQSIVPLRLFFHPTSGEFLGEGSYLNWQRFFRDAHRFLMIIVYNTIGLTIVCGLGVLMLISVVTSFVVYKGWWRGFWRLPRRQNRKVFWGDMHRLFGVWVIWLILLEGLTGVWYLSERYGLRAPKVERVAMQAEPEAQSKVAMPEVQVFSDIIDKRSQYYPELVVEEVAFDKKYGVLLQGQGNTVLVRPRANEINFYPLTGEFLSLRKGEELSIHGRISEAADPLHFGTFAGLYSKIVYFIFGIMLCTVAISGTYIYGMRVARTGRDDASPNKKIWASALANMTWGKWLSYVALGFCALVTIVLFGGLINI